MNTAQKLYQMGCGSEMVNSALERGNLHAAISNAKTFYKYCKDGVNSGLFQSPEQCFCYIKEYYNKLLSVQHLADKYRELYGEKFYKIKLQIEKFFSL